MSRRSRTALVAAALLAASAVAPSVAAAQTDTGLFSVSPSRQVVSGRPPKKLTPFNVSNTTKVPLTVTIFPVFLDQRLGGEFIFSERPADLRDAGTVAHADPASFVMQPGTRRQVVVTWDGLPSGTKVVNAGIVFQSVAKTTSAVQTLQRLLTLNFLQLPGHYSSTGKFTLLRAEQGQGRTLNILPRLKNTGEVVQSPQHGKVVVRDSTNAVVFKGTFSGDVILPEHERDFTVIVKKILQKGDYAMSASADFGESKRLHIVSKFTLVGPNQLPTPKVALEDLKGQGEIGGDSQATAVVHSIGSATAETNVKVQLFRLLKTGQRPQKPIKEQKLSFRELTPGARKDLRIVYPGLPAGKYRLVATYRDTPDTIARVEADFSPVKPKKEESTSLFLPILGGIGLLGLFLFFLLWRRRRRKEDDEEEKGQEAPITPPVAPAAAAPAPADERIDINTASLEELQRLPGVGPKAAARIMEHRAEYGRFESLDDLRQVEGFDGKRGDALADRVRF